MVSIFFRLTKCMTLQEREVRTLKHRPMRTLTFAVVALCGLNLAHAQLGSFTKAQVSDKIRKVEDGVDEFEKYLNNRGDDARSKAQSAQSSGTTRRRQSNSSNQQNRQNQAKQTKDDLEDAMDDLNQSTNRLRRKFGPASNYLETKAQMDQVMDSARRVNQVMTRGNYGSQPERYWAALRSNINDLARCYGLSPMGA
jgi:ABC-type transporter Mla subunit MlaD